MSTVASDEYTTIAAAARILGISEARIRYWELRDPKFPKGIKAGRTVVKPSAVAAYFRQLDTVQEVTGEPGNDDESGEE